jgi:predicted aldo/keto reductase-like oxidoreductase
MQEWFGKDTPKLGFGLMRLPKRADAPQEEDIEQVKKMVDLFLAAGLTYFDTAYVYDGGKSEAAIKEALVDRYPRESYTLATKLNAWMPAVRMKLRQNRNFIPAWNARVRAILTTTCCMRCRPAITRSTMSTTSGIS